MEIKTIPNLQLSESWNGVRLHEVAIQQGTLDGACGPYALITMLLLQETVMYKDIEKLLFGRHDGRTLLAKWLKSNAGLILSGTTTDDLNELLRSIKKTEAGKKISYEKLSQIVPTDSLNNMTNKDKLKLVASHIEGKNTPVLMDLQWDKENAHWVVAIGYQYSIADSSSEDPEIISILTVDPGSRVSRVSAWNGVLSEGYMNSKRLLYSTNEDIDSVPCRLADVLSFV